MTASTDFIASEPGQAMLRRLLRGTLRLGFRGLLRPPLPVAAQRLVLRALTAFAPWAPRMDWRPGRIGGRPCEWHRPDVGRERVVLYLHGGAYLVGSPASHRPLCAALAVASGATVCALDYRLAPEWRFPAPREDALAAYRELLEQGYPADRVFIAGDSAGGHLALCLALALPAAGLPAPAGLVCLSPWCDIVGEHRHEPPGGDPMLHRRWLNQSLALFRPLAGECAEAEWAPLRAELAGLPPLLIQVGEDELLRNDSLRLAERARAAGVAVRLERYPGLWHVFQCQVGLLDMADQAVRRIATFIQEHSR